MKLNGCFREAPTLAGLCRAPPLGNARRFGVDLKSFPRLLRAGAETLKPFADASRERQGDAE